MFCEFQIFSLYGTGVMGLRRRKMIKTPLKNFYPWTPNNMLSLFAYIFFKF